MATSNTAEVTVTLSETPDTSVAPTVKLEHVNYYDDGYTIGNPSTPQYEYPVGTVTVDGTDKTHTIVTYSNKTVTIKFPWVRWPAHASYKITVNGFKDTAGNTMTTAHSWFMGVKDDDTSYNAGAELTNITPTTAANSPNNVDRYTSDSNTNKRFFTTCLLGKSSGGGNCDTGTARNINWLDAISACIALNGDSFAGRSNWRLPSAAEANQMADGGNLDSGFVVASAQNFWVGINTSNTDTSVTYRATDETSNSGAAYTNSYKVFCASSP